ncbi:tetratricopeptide repeat protein [Komarekiella sp. 'clone 1']|uniref:Tetratricopeptide repeat protein n=1 Tax=Komarekiella delphini-convector SJRDD-AB1 TaxID=2593771 RepID=A0AA40VSE7_9NOST|nr:tetratricopeptide repeat protein [Komarekiella delphini-convector]MBD6617311.1 tetratricopeptide repeat protein [Komarekiella delphini-convector SJRDD-AB1]
MNSHLLNGRYRILTVLNTEEVTQTYLVEDTNLPNSKFVLKQLRPPSKNPQTLKILRHLFISKARTLQQLGQEHNQIQKLIDYFEEKEEFYIVQEYIFGNPLTEEVLQGKPLREDQLITLLLEILEILVFVHVRGIIHRDIKPTNIIRRHSDKKLVLVDFGVVKEVIITKVGNSEYLPNEQSHGNPKYNSDIYALGIVAIATIMGLQANDISRLKNQKNQLTGEIIWRNKTTEVSRKLANILNKMVRFNYRKRYQYATEVLEDLKQLTHEYDQEKQNQKKLWLILSGIAGCITLGVGTWFFQSPKPVSNTQKLYQQGVNKYEAGKFQEAVEDFTKAIQSDSQNALAYNRRGDTFYRLGDYQKAQADSSQAILLNPQDANAYYDRGFSLYELGKYKEAIADYTQAIKLDAKNPFFYYGRGLTRIKLKDNKGAIGDFSKAIAVKPDYSEAYLQRGILRRRLKLRQAAIQDFDAVIGINPSDAKAYYQRGLTQVANQQKDAAIKDYTNAISINPKYIEAYLNRGDIYSDQGEQLEATEDYNKVLQINPKLTAAYIHRGLHRFSFGDYKGAIEDYNQALELNSKDAAAYNNRGNAYLEMGNKKAANEDYSQAIAINSNYGLAYYNRGIVRAKMGNKKGAIADFKKSAKLFQQKGEKDSYKDALKEIANLQNSVTVKTTRATSAKREKN